MLTRKEIQELLSKNQQATNPTSYDKGYKKALEDILELDKCYIYYLEGGGEIRYVGCTINPAKRLAEHKTNKDRAVNKWVRSTSNVDLILLDSCTIKESAFWEEYYFNLFKSWGFDLLNLKDQRFGTKRRGKNLKSKGNSSNFNKSTKKSAQKSIDTRIRRGFYPKEYIAIDKNNKRSSFKTLDDLCNTLDLGKRSVEKVLYKERESYRGYRFERVYNPKI